MGKQARPFPTGHYRLYKTSRQKPGSAITVQLEYVVNSTPIRRASGYTVMEEDWNPNENRSRGGMRASYGADYRVVNNKLAKRLDSLDAKIAEWCEKHPNSLTVDIVKAFIDGLPTTRDDKGIDFGEYVRELLKDEYARNKIGQSVYKNGISNMNGFAQFLKAEKLGTHACDKIYVSEVTDTPLNQPYTPDRIGQLGRNDIFVFGSNLQGRHAGGAARIALGRFGAVFGQGVGLQGNSYAIPTMQGGVETIKPYTDEFIQFAKEHPELTFYVTKIGCGIAGFSFEEIAPLFKDAVGVENIRLPKEFEAIILAN